MSVSKPPDPDDIANTRSTSPQFLIFAVFFVVVILAISFGLRRFAGGATANGQPLKQVELQPLRAEGSPWNDKSLRGKVVLVNFWGTWCYPCRVELPELIALANEFEGQSNFLFLPVSCPNSRTADIETTKIETEEFLQEQDYDISCYYDARNTTRAAVAHAMELGDNFSYPTTVILDREGNIQGFWQGYSKKVIQEQRSLLKRLMK